MTRSKNRKKREGRIVGNRADGELPCFVIQESAIFGRYLESCRDLKPGGLILEKKPVVVGPSQESEAICIGCYKPLDYRYLESCRDLKPGELILEEKPVVVGPSQESEAICIGCYKPLDYSSACRCDQCGFPLCSQTCPGKISETGHAQDCYLMSKSRIKDTGISALSTSLEAITPLRILALQHKSSTLWEKITSMESHTEIRKKIKSLWATNQKNVADVIRNDWGLTEFDEETIHQMCGVLEVNAFEVGPGLRAIYPTAYLFAHNCVPNTKHSDDKHFGISFRSTVPVRKKTPLFVTYTYILQGTLKRRKHLKDTKFFDCSCDRCKDPTELGTNVSSLFCPMCLNSTVLSVDPLNSDANWACSSKNCPGYVISSKGVETIIERLYTKLDEINGNDITGYENFIKLNSKTLSENHYLNLSAQHCLYQLYGKIENYLINNLTEEQLLRKIELCKNLLRHFAQLEPGFSKQRGVILYELHAPLMILMQRSFHEKKHVKQIMKKMVNEVSKSLEEAKNILKTEPEGNVEFEISEAAREAFQSLSIWQSVLDKA